jgi:hypothetical protein
MTYTAAEGRQQVLDALAQATDEIALALAAFGEAYEQLDENSGDRLEEQLFRPTQAAYGAAKRTHADFSQRYGVPPRTFAMARSHVRPHDVRGEIEEALAAAEQADVTLGELQDSMLPIEVGDVELRAGLSEVRRLIDVLPTRGRDLLRILGR